MGRTVSMVIAPKRVMGEWLLRLPTQISSMRLQMANWQMPDKKLWLDIASGAHS